MSQGVRAHSIYSWEVEDNDLVRAKTFSKASNFIKHRLEHMLKTESLESRKKIVDSIFDTLKESGYERLSDFKEEGFSELFALFAKKIEKGISHIDPKEAILSRVDNIKEMFHK